MPTAQFTFHGNLRDFLLPGKKHSPISYSFNNTPAVKDAIEAIGIPHVEVNTIVINGHTVSFSHPLHAGAVVEVYPFLQIPFASSCFVLDVHLGKLATLLRLLGFDTLYQNNFTDKQIVSIAKEQERIVLTRDIGLLKHKSIQRGYWLRSQQPVAQVKETVHRFSLGNNVHPFRRCLSCNGLIQPVAKQDILDQLPPNTVLYFHEFYQCRNCKKVYWKGSHYERMLQLISDILK